MKVSIIVVTRNRCGALKETLGALRHIFVPQGISPELIVVDNGSTDATSAVVKSVEGLSFPIRYLYVADRGKAASLNAALKIAEGEIFLFTDDDVHPSPAWLSEITDPIINKRCDMVCGAVRIAPYLLRPWMTETHKAWLASTECLNPENPECALGANMAFSREVLMRVPWFDPELGPGSLGLWEDTLFSLQAKEAGFRLGFASRAIVEHRFDISRLSRDAFLSRILAEARSAAYVAWHWRHEEQPFARLRMLSYMLQLGAKRLLRWVDWHNREGLALWELNLLSGIAFYRYFLRERKRPRRYVKWGLQPL
jgi:glycosyltransferase involved in cell wall biosynthesis